jgi:hypothetical protein
MDNSVEGGHDCRMPDRDTSLAAMRARLAQSQADSSVLLGNEADRDAEALYKATDLAADPGSAYALGWFYWMRYAQSETSAQEDLAAALECFVAVYPVHPEAVPEPIRELFDGLDESETRRQALELLDVYRSTNDLQVLHQVIALFRADLAALSDGHPDYANRVISLGDALVKLYVRTKDADVLEESLQHARAAVATTLPGDSATTHRLIVLSNTLNLTFERSGDQAVLREAVKVGQAVLDVMASNDPHRNRVLLNQAHALRLLSEQTGEVDLLQAGVRVRRELLRAATPGTVEHHSLASDLSAALQAFYNAVGDAGALDEAIRLSRRSAAATPPGNARIRYLTNLTNALNRDFERTNALDVLAEATATARQTLAEMPDAFPDRAPVLCNLRGALMNGFHRLGDVSLLHEAIIIEREAVASISPDDPRRGQHLADLGSSLRALADRTDDLGTLRDAVETTRASVAVTAVSGSDLSRHLNIFGNALSALFERTGETQLLRESVQAKRDAVDVLPERHPTRAITLSNLALGLRDLAEHEGDGSLQAEALGLAREAVTLTKDEDPERGVILTNLSRVLQAYCRRTGDTALLEEAVRVDRTALEVTAPDHPRRETILSNMAAGLHTLHQRTASDTTLITEMLTALRESLRTVAADNPLRASLLGNLAIALEEFSDHTGEIEPLREAVDAARQSISATPADHPDLAERLGVYGTVLKNLSERTGNTTLLDEAADLQRRALTGTPVGHPNRARRLHNLTVSLVNQFDNTGDTTLLAEAIQATRDALAATPADHPDRATFFNALGVLLRDRFGYTRDLTHLAEAADASRRSVTGVPGDHPIRAMYLGNLATALDLLFEHTGELSFAEEQVEVARQSVAAAPPGHPNRAMLLANLCAHLRGASVDLDSPELLVEAIRAGRDALVAYPHDHPGRAGAQFNLAISLLRQYERTQDDRLHSEAIAYLEAAAANPGNSAPRRIDSYRHLALQNAGRDNGLPTIQAMEAATNLLPMAAPGSLTIADRGHRLARHAGLAAQAAAAAVDAGRPDRALQLLEQTRGILIAETLGVRGDDHARLGEQHPDIAAELLRLRQQLDDRHPSSAGIEDSGPRQALDRRTAYQQWQDLVDRIRQLPGFTGFLHAPGLEEFTEIAAKQPIVFVYTTFTRSDALVVTGSSHEPVRVVPLPELTLDAAVRRALQLAGTVHTASDNTLGVDDHAVAQREVLDVLAWLWDAVTEPILAALGHTAIPAGEWPRLWWCPVGTMARLPLHAAGHHADHDAGDPAPRSVLDRVVSSYLTTLRGLTHVRGSELEPDASPMVVVQASQISGVPELPGAAREAAAIAALVPGSETLAHPRRADVLAALPRHRMAHFACHGVADWTNPAASQLLIEDHRIEPLTVLDISALRLRGGLAFLSACETTVTDPRLTDESVHITGAFHLAGYQHVIGTLWPVGDWTAAQLAIDFYNRLTVRGEPRVEESAYALHHAVRQLRARYPTIPTAWAAYLHTGL